MRVFEIFRSIQGETTRAGLPMWFVRLAGCDLRCSYCDTAAARDPEAGRAMTVEEVVAAVSSPALPHVAITGGEPMHQAAEVNALVAALVGPQGAAEKGSGALSVEAPDPFSAGPVESRGAASGAEKGSGAIQQRAPDPFPALISAGREVLIETNGAHPIDALDPRAIRIVDVKTPGSGMADRTCWRNLDLVTARDEVKFVLTGRNDYEWAKNVLARHRLIRRTTVLFGAAAPLLDPATLARWILDDHLPVRLNLQLHKLLGLP
ncbi:MAG: 4Fe-4S cluster-binding domain-containing protein [Planctomycetota bacterium]|nr:4Fe-4S cluster-binding domain-containing protein [Planctomycetota bacterium]